MTAENQRANVARAASVLAGLVGEGHSIVITHGNGPQVGLLALQAQSSLFDLVFSRTRGALHDQVMTMLTQFRLADRAWDAAATLSHGQKQWLEIAMALAGKPRLLLLDEPTGGMSLEERRVTGELLQPIRQHCSLVIVEHDLDFIRDICDRLTVLDQGRVLESGTVAEIQASKNVQEIYLRRA